MNILHTGLPTVLALLLFGALVFTSMKTRSPRRTITVTVADQTFPSLDRTLVVIPPYDADSNGITTRS